MNEYSQGQHICAVYDTPEEQLAIAAEYLFDGLCRGERAYYVAASAEALQSFNDVLAAKGLDVAQALRTTALLEATHAEAHLVDGRFDSERMLRLLNEGIESALHAGFVGFRTCGEMSWLLGEPSGSDQIVEYEALLNHMFLGTMACGMCLYDASRLPMALVDHGLATHWTVVIDRQHKPNPFYRQPEVARHRVAQPDQTRAKLQELRRA
jgi:hypothetical protein